MSYPPERQRVPRQRPRKGFWSWFAIVLVVVAANQLIALPYYVITPGGATAVGPAIEIPDEQRIDPTGSVLFTTVSLAEARPFDFIWTIFDPNDEIVPRQEVRGDQSQEEYLELNAALMANSQQVATAVAMREAGYAVDETGVGAAVVTVADGSPAQGILNAGDLIVSVDGQSIGTSGQLVGAVQSEPPGTALSFEVGSVEETDEAMRTVNVTTAEHPNFPGSSFLGVELRTLEPELVTPFPVDVDLGAVGGPSAGLAIALSTLDLLTAGELTGGREIAVTGTLAADGTVGPVGGVQQKVVAVDRRSDAEIFIVPAQEADQVRDSAPDGIEVIGVSSFAEAIDALVAAGGDRPQPVIGA